MKSEGEVLAKERRRWDVVHQERMAQQLEIKGRRKGYLFVTRAGAIGTRDSGQKEKREGVTSQPAQVGEGGDGIARTGKSN